jgi:hypothetical protein
MCRPINEGGQRCAAHTRAKEQQARDRLNAVAEEAASKGPAAVLDAHDKWVAAATDYASTEEGRDVLTREEGEAWSTGDINRAAVLNSIIERGATKREANEASRSAILHKRGLSNLPVGLDYGTHWKCQECFAAGEGEVEQRCPNCKSTDVATFLRTEPSPVLDTAGLTLTPGVQAAVDRRKAAFADKQEKWATLERLNAQWEQDLATRRAQNPQARAPRRGKDLMKAERAFDAAESAAEFAYRDVEMAVRQANRGASEGEIMTLARSLA